MKQRSLRQTRGILEEFVTCAALQYYCLNEVSISVFIGNSWCTGIRYLYAYLNQRVCTAWIAAFWRNCFVCLSKISNQNVDWISFTDEPVFSDRSHLPFHQLTNAVALYRLSKPSFKSKNSTHFLKQVWVCNKNTGIRMHLEVWRMLN